VTGIVNRVSACDSTIPPTTATPSGWRNSGPAPIPMAIGRMPKIAAIVVMIGRKRAASL
jgi:hypothetical protein